MKKKLIKEDTQIEDKYPCKVKRTVIPLDLKLSSPDSLLLMKVMEQTKNDEIFKTEIVKMVIDYK